MKRAFLVMLALLLAGCTLPGEEADEPQLFGACPQWIASGETIEHTIQVNGSSQLNLTAPLEFQNRSLDMFLLQVSTDAPMRIQAYLHDGGRTAFHEVEGDELLNPPTWQLQGEGEARVFLSPVEQGAPPAPGVVRLSFDGAGTVEVTALPHYRVCGVLLE